MMPHEPVCDIMHRTMYNLTFVEDHAAPHGPFEVTQLINSFLGALAHPWEKFQDDLRVMPLEDARKRGWPAIDKERATDKAPVSLGDLLRLMRNALAHGNIEFLPGLSGEIQAMRLWNCDRRRRTWGAIISTTNMRMFLARFVKLIEELDARSGRLRSQIA